MCESWQVYYSRIHAGYAFLVEVISAFDCEIFKCYSRIHTGNAFLVEVISVFDCEI